MQEAGDSYLPVGMKCLPGPRILSLCMLGKDETVVEGLGVQRVEWGGSKQNKIKTKLPVQEVGSQGADFLTGMLDLGTFPM